MESEPAVAAVAHAGIRGVLASAEIDRLGFGGLVFHGREFGSLVASVAKWLVGAASAGTPKIDFAGFDGDGIRAFLGDDWFGHDENSSIANKNFLNWNISDGPSAGSSGVEMRLTAAERWFQRCEE
jgi:hypothetical protein